MRRLIHHSNYIQEGTIRCSTDNKFTLYVTLKIKAYATNYLEAQCEIPM